MAQLSGSRADRMKGPEGIEKVHYVVYTGNQDAVLIPKGATTKMKNKQSGNPKMTSLQ
jgi:hypothetical protein